jgi:hypothetical protein
VVSVTRLLCVPIYQVFYGTNYILQSTHALQELAYVLPLLFKKDLDLPTLGDETEHPERFQRLSFGSSLRKLSLLGAMLRSCWDELIFLCLLVRAAGSGTIFIIDCASYKHVIASQIKHQSDIQNTHR